VADSPILVAGAGIGGLTAALALGRAGFRVIVFEAARELQEIGAGIQLSPNASRLLIGLGLGEGLQACSTAPEAVRIIDAHSGSLITSIPLGASAEAQYGAPYWLIHRGDLQRVLLDAVSEQPNITLRLGVRIRGHRATSDGVIVAGKTANGVLVQFDGHALIGADGLWSAVRESLGHKGPPQFAGRTAWRATLPSDGLERWLREPAVHLWLGRKSHLVHYPVQAGGAINVVAITESDEQNQDWNGAGTREMLAPRFAKWAAPARAIVEAPDEWRTWSLYQLPPLAAWGAGPVTLLGDAAHAMLPFVAQGGAMAVEDACVLTACLTETPDDPAGAFRAYEHERQARTQQVAQAAASAANIYHFGQPLALARNVVMRAMGGERLRSRYDYIYGWTP
jgi:salicylate hydroxylase